MSTIPDQHLETHTKTESKGIEDQFEKEIYDQEMKRTKKGKLLFLSGILYTFIITLITIALFYLAIHQVEIKNIAPFA